MRLSCPNCGAQYEVPDEVIPAEGRDVQCSNCGNTWFQAHASAAPVDETRPETPPAPETEPDDHHEPDAPEEIVPDPDPMPDVEVAAPRRDMDQDVTDILREEAARESELRAKESESLESQPDLGLEAHPGEEPERRAREARDRMARLRGEEPAAVDRDSSSRRGLLPDIEEINSTLRGGSESSGVVPAPAQPGPAKSQKSGGFARGFTVAIIFGVVLLLLYLNAERISQTLPQTDPMLSAYVALVDQARVWLDSQVTGFSQQ